MSKLTMQVIGHLGGDAVVKNANGKNVIEFSIAHSEKWRDASQVLHEKTTWAKCSYWTDKTNIAQYLTKGSLIEVSGQPSASAYMKDGNPMASLEMRVNSISLLSSTRQDNPQPQQSNQTQAATQPQPQQNDVVDDLPF